MDIFLQLHVLLVLLPLTALRLISACLDGDCRELAFPSVFFFANKRLINHKIATVQVQNMGDCELRCYQEPDCVSINFERKAANAKGKHSCDLNNATHRGNDGEFVDADGFFYRGSESACDTAHCDNGGTCQSGFTDKGYRCLCPPGFMFAHCKQDINECASAVHNCSPNAICNNTAGSYTCKCKPGYTGDGFSCKDINECASAVHNCSPSATCNNTAGSYTCKCKPGYSCCPEDWVSFNVSCYYITSTQANNVDNARKQCTDMGADLPIIYSDEENTFIFNMLKDKVGGNGWLWLGLLRNLTDNSKFYWVDGTPIKGNYDAWNTDEPSNKNSVCAYIGNSGTWNDFSCRHDEGPSVLCQRTM